MVFGFCLYKAENQPERRGARVEPPKRVRWTKKRGGEMKKQGAMRSEGASRATMFLRGNSSLSFSAIKKALRKKCFF